MQATDTQPAIRTSREVEMDLKIARILESIDMELEYIAEQTARHAAELASSVKALVANPNVGLPIASLGLVDTAKKLEALDAARLTQLNKRLTVERIRDAA